MRGLSSARLFALNRYVTRGEAMQLGVVAEGAFW